MSIGKPTKSVNNGDNGVPFKTLVVLEFASVPQATVEWILAKLTMSRTQGGGELLAKIVSNEQQEVSKEATLQGFH